MLAQQVWRKGFSEETRRSLAREAWTIWIRRGEIELGSQPREEVCPGRRYQAAEAAVLTDNTQISLAHSSRKCISHSCSRLSWVSSESSFHSKIQAHVREAPISWTWLVSWQSEERGYGRPRVGSWGIYAQRAQITSMHTHGATPSDVTKLNLSKAREWIRILIRELQGGALTLRHHNKI